MYNRWYHKHLFIRIPPTACGEINACISFQIRIQIPPPLRFVFAQYKQHSADILDNDIPCNRIIQQRHLSIQEDKPSGNESSNGCLNRAADKTEQGFHKKLAYHQWPDNYGAFTGMTGKNFSNYTVLGVPTFFLLGQKGMVLKKTAMVNDRIMIIDKENPIDPS
jgi:hypothetical protein